MIVKIDYHYHNLMLGKTSELSNKYEFLLSPENKSTFELIYC